MHLSVLHAELLDEESKPVGGLVVRVISERTAAVRRVVSDTRGRVTLTQLQPDTYRLEVDDIRYPNFVARVLLRAGEVVEVELPLAVGSVATVDARPFFITIDRHSPSLRTRLEDTLLTRIPLESRTVTDLVLLAPATTAGDFGAVGSGVGLTSTAYFLDGSRNLEPRLGAPAVMPPIESLNQVDVVRAGYDAASAAHAGAEVNVTTRSGGNVPEAAVHALYQTRADRAWLGGFAGGALTKNRTFIFGDAEYRPVDEVPPFRHDGHHLGARVDHGLGEAAWVTGRYALTRGTALHRRGQHAAARVTHVPASRLANEARVGFSRVSFGEFADLSGLAESDAWQIADTLTWWSGPHLVGFGGEWYGFSRGVDSGELAAHLWSVYAQDDWRATRTVTISTGLRVERFTERVGDDSGDTIVAPRMGFAWALGEELRTAIRGAYGRSANHDGLKVSRARTDHWSLGAQRQMGRLRTLEFTYLGSRGDERPSLERTMGYHAFQVQMQQRSETGLSGQFAYTLGRWSTEAQSAGARVRSPYDSRHKATAAFSWPLPVGDEQRWLHRGLLGEILRDLEVAGVAALQSGRPLSPGSERQQPQYHRLDVALLKFVRAGESTVQLRLDVFNLTNRTNPADALFGADHFDSLLPRIEGRRYQFGAKVNF